MQPTITNDPSKSLPGWDFVPYYDDPDKEYKRLIGCLQQQIEDTFTIIGRIQSLASDNVETAQTIHAWKTLREGLRCWRAAIRCLT